MSEKIEKHIIQPDSKEKFSELLDQVLVVKPGIGDTKDTIRKRARSESVTVVVTEDFEIYLGTIDHEIFVPQNGILSRRTYGYFRNGFFSAYREPDTIEDIFSGRAVQTYRDSLGLEDFKTSLIKSITQKIVEFIE